jgi:hypothetical protein
MHCNVYLSALSSLSDGPPGPYSEILAGFALRTAFSMYLPVIGAQNCKQGVIRASSCSAYLRFLSTAVIFSFRTASRVLALASASYARTALLSSLCISQDPSAAIRTESVDEVHDVQQLELHSLDLLGRRPVLAKHGRLRAACTHITAS